MGLLRKKTAAEKERKKEQREEKKELRQEKRDKRKDAREEKKEIRKDAQDAKQDVRKSGASGKEKRDAKKDIREEKRKDLKGVRKDKRSEIKEIRSEIKEVKGQLDIKLPTKPGNVALLREDLREIRYRNGSSTQELVLEDAFEILDTAYERAKKLVARGLKPLEDIVDGPRDRWESLWSGSSVLIEWFGDVERPKHVKDVHDRLQSVERRLNKQLTIRLHPQRDMDVNAQNNGTFFEPKTCKVFPKLFKSSLDSTTQAIGHDYIASVLIHELIHLWFTDQKLDGEKVYGASKARKLAKDDPKKARRSAENYEHYCLSFA